MAENGEVGDKVLSFEKLMNSRMNPFSQYRAKKNLRPRRYNQWTERRELDLVSDRRELGLTRCKHSWLERREVGLLSDRR